MDTHTLAMLTYEALQRRKKKREEQQAAETELKHKIDMNNVGWNGYTQVVLKRQKRYYTHK